MKSLGHLVTQVASSTFRYSRSKRGVGGFRGFATMTAKADIMSTSKFIQNKEKYLNMDLDEKRKVYACKEDYVDLSKVIPWSEYFKKIEPSSDVSSKRSVDPDLNEKVSLWQGDITTLEIDAIVNAANSSLLGGGGVDGAIHRAAGSGLLTECETLLGCPEGQAKISGGYKLPSKYVIHTVGPRGEKPEVLTSCYQNSLSLMLKNNLKSIAIPCIATGIYGYPREAAANVALTNVREFLEKNKDNIDRVIFTVFLKEDVQVYEDLLPKYFPVK